MLADYHVHTYYSDDSKCPMEEMIQKAIELGIEEIAFTDHVDYGIKIDENCNYKEYFKELTAKQQKYEGKLQIKAGIEFGVQTHTVAQFQKDFETWPFQLQLAD